MNRTRFGWEKEGLLWQHKPGIVRATHFTPQIVIEHIRWRADDGVEGSGGATFLKAEDVNINVGPGQDVGLDANVRLRFQMDEQNVDDMDADILSLNFNISGGGFNILSTTSTGLILSASTHFANADATTDHGFTNPAGTFIAGAMSETNSSFASVDPAQNQYWIYEFCIQCVDADLLNNDTFGFEFRGFPNTNFSTGDVGTIIKAAAPGGPPKGTLALLGVGR